MLDLSANFVASLLELKLFLRQKVSLLVDALFDTLQGHFAANRQGIALKDVSAPFHPIPFNVRQELLEQNAFVVQLLFLLLLYR